jgi:hypothetical protein
MATSKKKPSEIRKKIDSLAEENEYYAMLDTANRARSLSVGTTTGGIIEVTLRSERATLYYLMRPVEAVEIIEQLAASCGLEIAKRPKQDFTAWRSWDLDTPDVSDWKGTAPWQLSDSGKKQLKKHDDNRYAVLPASTQTDKPKLQASSKRKNKVEETEE